jgi:hypothetical protein
LQSLNRNVKNRAVLMASPSQISTPRYLFGDADGHSDNLSIHAGESDSLRDFVGLAHVVSDVFSHIALKSPKLYFDWNSK